MSYIISFLTSLWNFNLVFIWSCYFMQKVAISVFYKEPLFLAWSRIVKPREEYFTSLVNDEGSVLY